MDAIQTIALHKRFRRVHAVRDVNLTVETGAVYALMGPNGAGKTTLIKMLMNLMSPTRGSIHVFAASVGRLEGRGLETIGYVSENQKLPDWMSVGMFLAYCRAFYPTWDSTLEQHLVRRFELPLKRRLKHLSRGMRMKAALASALAFHPKLIVLDEPLSGLDPLVRDELMESLKERAQETTALLSSHDLAEIESFSSHIGYMQSGQLLLSEPKTSVHARFRNVVAVVDVPLAVPPVLPAEWLHFSSSGSTAQWAETNYDADRSTARAREIFGAVQLSSASMTLREVFLTMAYKSEASKPNAEVQ